jgi:hypothetical protein
MKNKSCRFFLFCLVLALILLACSPWGGIQSPDLTSMQTSVAQTVVALGSSLVATMSSEALPVPAGSTQPPPESTPGETFPFEMLLTLGPPTSEPPPESTFPYGMLLTYQVSQLKPYTYEVSNSVSVPAGKDGYVTATCPPNSLVVGGGFVGGGYVPKGGTGFFAGGQAGFEIFAQLMDANGWMVAATNWTNNPQLLNAYAVCLFNSTGVVTQVTTQVSIQDHQDGHARIDCPEGSGVTGGGYNIWNSNVETLIYNAMVDNGWEVYARNYTSKSHALTVAAVCLAGTEVTASMGQAQKSISSGTAGSVEYTCPSGSILSNGGFSGDNRLLISDSNMKTGDPQTWLVAANNPSAFDLWLNVYGVCLTFP